MTIALVIIGDGRDEYLIQCTNSLQWIEGDISELWMYDDSGDTDYRRALMEHYPNWRHINGGERLGCAGAFQTVWRTLAMETRAKFIFLVEQDFRFIRHIDLGSMAELLDDRPYLAEIALIRQPWNSEEKRAGGIVEWHPDWYTDMNDDIGRHWLEHRNFTTNPCLFRRTLLNIPWPAHRPDAYSEGIFSHHIHTVGTSEANGEEVRCAYWGARDSGIWTEHIGHHRIGMGY